MVLDDSIKIGKYAIPRNCITLGKGSFAYVLLGHEDQEPTKKAAIKVVSKKKLNSSVLGKELEILEMLSKFRHANLVTFLHSEESRDHIFLVTEFCNGGDLEKYLNTVKVIPEPSLAHLLRHIAGGLQCLKQLNIVHRDLKPANILMTFPDVRPKNFFDITFKIADFGFAKLLEEQMMTSTICGSPIYMAPEIYKCQSYNYKADMWSVGVIAHQCAMGRVPFCERSFERLGRVYKDGKATFELPDNLCRELKGLLKMLLVQDADKRLEFDKFINHPFLLLHSESSTYFRRSSESAIKTETAKETTRLGTSTSVSNNFAKRRISSDARSQMENSLLDGFVVVEHHMIPDAENCDIRYGKSRGGGGIKFSAPQKVTKRKVMVTRDTQTSTRFDSCVDASGCSVDPDVCKMKELKRRNEMVESPEIKKKSLIACINLDDIILPDVSMDFESKMMKTNQSNMNGDWSSIGSLSMDRGMSDSKTSFSTVFDDLSDHFVSPELDEKLLMEFEEVKILEKLEFLLKFTQFATRLAEHGSLWVVSPSSSSSSSSITSLSSSAPLLCDSDRLCLYARCLLVTLSAVNCAKTAAKEARVSPSKTLRKIVSDLKDAYVLCLKRSEEVKRRLPTDRCDDGSQIKAAETILYLFAVEAAREGAKAEFSLKSFHECCQFYHIAYVFLHWVEMKSKRNKASVKEYKNRIEGRLKYFQNNFVVPCSD